MVTSVENLTLAERDSRVLWHPFTQAKTACSPIPIVRGKGAHLYADDGRVFLDGISSWWVNLHGHSHPYLVEKIRYQAETLEHVIFTNFTHLPAIELAERLIPLLPGKMSKIFFSDNGSTAVETALKMALQYWHNRDRHTKRTQVISFKGGYHGDTFGAISAAGNLFNTPFWSCLFEVASIDPPWVGEEKRSLVQLERILAEGNAACFIFEPLVLGAAGMKIYSSQGLESLIQMCRAHQVLTIADEVMTGFGRTGTLFACQQLQGEPDIICLSKGLTGGFLPLGVTACKEEIYSAFFSERLEEALLHGHSYSGNPLACSSALASLDLLEKKECERQRGMIQQSHQIFCLKWNGDPRLKRCESLGTLLVVEYYSEESSAYFNPLRQRLSDFFLERSILLRPLGNVVYVLPPYCITPEELQRIYEAIEESLEGLNG